MTIARTLIAVLLHLPLVACGISPAETSPDANSKTANEQSLLNRSGPLATAEKARNPLITASTFASSPVGQTDSHSNAIPTSEEETRSQDLLLPKELNSPNPDERIEFLESLTRAGNSPQALLTASVSLGDPSNRVRESALGLLYYTDTIPTDSVVQVALNDPSPGVRIDALALLHIRDTQALRNALQFASFDSSPEVRHFAQELLTSLTREQHILTALQASSEGPR